MQKTQENHSIYQNLLDAGCSAEKAEQYEKLAGNGEWNTLLRELAKPLHESERQIDCLDFLVYEIHKKHKGAF